MTMAHMFLKNTKTKGQASTWIRTTLEDRNQTSNSKNYYQCFKKLQTVVSHDTINLTKGNVMAYIHQINQFDIDNDFGQGPVVSVFFNFCPFHCKNCWNKSTWERQEDLYWDNQKAADTIIKALNKLKDRHMKPNLSLLGGDPLVPENIKDTTEIIEYIKKEIPEVTICAWTGFDIEDWWRKAQYTDQKKLSKELNLIVDGRFIEKLKTKNQMFGSINQRVIDTHKLWHYLGGNTLPNAIQKALAYPNTKLTVLDTPSYQTTPKQLMATYLDTQNRSRTYQLTVLHNLADYKKEKKNL